MKSSCKKHERDILLRKVRIIISDPYATDDSSSDESLELPKTPKVKRIVHEINLQSQLSKSSKDRCDCVKTSRKKSPRKSKKPVGVRLMPSGRWAAEITNPFTKTRKRLGTFETPEEAEKACADKKVEYSELTSSCPAVSSLVSVISVNSQCLRSAASPPCVNADDLCKKKMSSNKDVVVSDDPTNEVYFNFDLFDLQNPDLSFLATEEDSMVSSANCGELDFDRFFMDDESGHLLDDFSLLDSDFNICGFGNSIPSELPECDFTDVELELGDLKFASADPRGPN